MGPNQNNSNSLPNQFTRAILKRVLKLEKFDNSNTGSPLKEVGTGNPNYDSTVNSYRTGRFGLGETNPEEMFDCIGTPATGGWKYEYTYGTGEVHRVQFGGENILSELGVPIGVLKANLFDSFGITTQTNIRAYFVTGDISGSSPANGKLSSTMGVQNLANGHQNFVSVFPTDGASGAAFTTRIAAQISSTEYSYATLKDIGEGAGYDQEPLAELLTRNAEGNSSGYTVNPHVFNVKNLVQLRNYGIGTFIPGYVHTDNIAKTGTAETTLGQPTFSLSVDVNGDIIETPVNNYITLEYNIPISGITSTKLTWLGEAREESTGEIGDYVTDFACNNQHLSLLVNSLTGTGDVTITGVSISESGGVPTAAIDEIITVDATGRYQSSKKWLEVTNIDIPAGITAINYDIGVLGYVDLWNKDFTIEGFRVDMTSGGVNSDIAIRIIKVQDDGAGKCTLIDLENMGIDASTNTMVDGKRTAGDDRSYTTLSSLWENSENASLKASDYSTFFSGDENIFEGSTKAEGFIIYLEGTGGGNINNVDMLNLSLDVKVL